MSDPSHQNNSNILIIDDDRALRDLMGRVIARMGHRAHKADCAGAGLDSLRSDPCDVVLLDVNLPDGNGLKILPSIMENDQAPEVIIITGYGDPDAAETAIKNGAWDYLVKPSSVDNIILTIQRALAYRKEKQGHTLPTVLKRDDIVGKSSLLNATLEQVAQAAAVESNVLISGETGTGKELFAQAVHENSSRNRHPFVVVDCAALPESLVESVLFGHVKGAFTGAEKARQGLIRQAHGGTLFLDEVGELPMSVQKAFLRVIQERCFRPVNSQQETRVNFRLIAATNRDLDQMAQSGQFRSDLLYRLRSINVDTPPLRHRRGDIRRLTVYHVNRLCEIYNSEVKGISNEFLEALEKHPWPGNVRELFNTLEESLAMAGTEPTLHLHHLPMRLRAMLTRLKVKAGAHSTAGQEPAPAESEGFLNIQEYRDRMEYRYLERLIRITGGNRKESCRLSGLSRTRLFELLKKHGLGQPATRKPETASKDNVPLADFSPLISPGEPAVLQDDAPCPPL